MAPNVTLHFFAANDISGSVVYTVTDEDPVFRGLTLKLDRSGLGGGELLLSRAAGEDFAFPAESFARILIASYSDTDYYPWGLFLNKRLATVIDKDEDGGEVYRFGGAGPKMYLDRGRLGIGGPAAGWNVDLENGVWRWGNAATVGRILERIRAQDSNMDDPALGALTLNFDETDDSNGVAWTDTSLGAGDAPYTIPIGTSMLQSLYDFEDLIELSSWIDLGTVASPKYELNVIQGLGDDVTGSAFGAGVCLLREGDNIANNGLTVEGHALRKASHVIVEGADGAWVIVERLTFNPGDYVKYAKTEFPRTSQTNLLTKSGLRWLQRQDLGEREYEIDILPGANDVAGAYFPAPDRVLWLNNLISLDTSAVGITPTLLDIGPSTEQLVTGIELKLGEASDDSSDLKKARSWEVTVHLNRERPGTVASTPDQRSASSGGGGCKCIQLCGTGIIESDLSWKVLEHASQASGDINPEPADWKDVGFDDSTWDDPIEIWYSEPNLPTEAVAISGANAVNLLRRHEFFFRKEFWIAEDELTGPDVPFSVFYDDGLAVYINGATVLTRNTPFTGGAAAHTTTLPRSSFQAGWNSVGVYLWNQGGGSDGGNPNPGPSVFQLQIDIPAADHGVGTGGRAARCDHTHTADEVFGLEGGGGVTDHGALTGLTDQDHPASAIAVTDAGGYFSGTDAEAVLQELGALGFDSGAFYAQPSITRYGGNFSTGTTGLTVTMGTAPAVGECLLLVVGSGNNRKPNSISQTNVTWTERYNGSGNNQHVTIYTGVAAAGAGTSIGIGFPSSGQQQAEAFVIGNAPGQFTSVSAINTSTAGSGTVVGLLGSLTGGGWYLAAVAQPVANGWPTLNQPFRIVSPFNGQLGVSLFRANAEYAGYWRLSNASAAYFGALVRLT